MSTTTQVLVHCSHDEMVDLFQLVPNPRNPNHHPKQQIDLLAKIITQQGWRAPITVSRLSGFIVRGHGRLMAAQQLGLSMVPVDYQDYMTAAEEWADLIADNKIAELSEVNDEDLAKLMAELDGALPSELFGMSQEAIAELIATTAAGEAQKDHFDIDAVLEQSKKGTITQLGDLWQLGSHRLLCGNCTDPEVIARLMAGEKAAMIFTDPPYNVNYESDDGKKIQNDNMPSELFNKFLFESFSRMIEVAIPGAPIYVCHADSEGSNFRGALVDAGWLLKQCLIWVKNGFVLGRQDYQWKHEPILYGWKPGAAHRWYGKRKQSTVIDDLMNLTIQEDGQDKLLTVQDGINTIVLRVPSYEVVVEAEESSIWRVDKPLRSEEHPTMKPIKLCAKAIRNSSMAGDIVLDSFGGSGSTLIACEQTGRRGFTTELDPVYCDVIVKRWEELTGAKATLLTD